MSLDPVTFVAQIVNLAILIFLLYKLLYKPLLNAIDQREQRITEQTNKARSDMLLAEEKLKELNKQAQETETKRAEIMANAMKEADALKADLENQAREEIAKKRDAWMNELDVEKSNLEAELRTMIVDNFNNFSKKALKDLADTNLETQIISVLDKKFNSLSKQEKDKIINSEKCEVVHSFDMDDVKRKAILQFLKNCLKIEEENVSFRKNDTLVCGIEVIANGNVLSWNLNEYLKLFTNTMSDSLAQMSRRVRSKD
ncbi:MAG: hypothetical protein MJ247_01370 [Alphaproteobacteria bacterium]|nr:hypothetical protein [Alphaproteobacteria bacterium]